MLTSESVEAAAGLPGAAAPDLTRPVLLYSSTCRFCRWAARTIRAIDRGNELAYVPLTEAESAPLLASVPDDRRLQSWWLVRPGGEPVPGERGGGVALLRALRVTRPLAWLLQAAGGSPLVDTLDVIVARHRGRLSRFVPDGPAPKQYP